MDKPRSQHYDFAHRALPQLAHADCGWLTENLSGPGGQEFLLGLWAHIGSQLPPEENLSSFGIGYTLARVDNERLVIIIRLPEPLAVPEAYFVALIVRKRVGASEAASLLTYLTLELGFNVVRQTPYTVLGGWGQDGTHFNYGAGPDPTEEDFFATIAGKLFA